MVGVLGVLLLGRVDSAGAAPNATTLYNQAFATTKAWSVHYTSTGTEEEGHPYSRPAIPARRRAPSRC